MRSSNSAKEENCKNNNFVKKFATEQISWCTVFNGKKTQNLNLTKYYMWVNLYKQLLVRIRYECI